MTGKLPAPGLRIYKTVIAVVICAFLGYITGIHPFYTIIAAILCMQSSTEESMKKGAIRLVGTAIGGVFALFILLLIDLTPLDPFSAVYYLIISLCVLPLIYTNVLLGKQASSYITCVAFFSIVLSHFDTENHYLFALQRMLETAAGIVISVAVNRLIKPKNDDTQE